MVAPRNADAYGPGLAGAALEMAGTASVAIAAMVIMIFFILFLLIIRFAASKGSCSACTNYNVKVSGWLTTAAKKEELAQ
jgi:hypothetical protein